MPNFPRGIKAMPRLATPPRFPQGLESWGESGKGQFRSTQAMGRVWTEVYPLLDGSLPTVRALIAAINQSLREKIVWDVQHPYWHVRHGVGGGTIHSDPFTRADNAGSVGSMPTGLVWTALLGTWGILSNAAYTSAAVAEGSVVVNSGSPDGVAQVKILAYGGGQPALVGRVVDANNLWRVVYAGGTIFLQKRIAGSYTVVRSQAHTPADGDVYQLEFNGNTVTGRINGATIGGSSATDSTHNSATRWGLGIATATNATSIRFDDFFVQGIGGGLLLVNGANQTGSSLIVDGAAADIQGWLRVGDIIEVAGQPVIYDVTADVDTNGAGQATIPIHPPIFVGRSPADNAAVTIDPTAIYFKAVIVDVPEFPSMDVTRHIDPGLTLTWREQPL